MSDERRRTSHPATRRGAYILRLWGEQPANRQDPLIWRVSLQDIQTRAQRGFASLEEFFAYLEAVCGEEENP